MALIRELLRSDVKDLTVVAYGGPEVGMLGAAGKVRKLIYGFVSLDTVPIEPRPGPNPRTTLSRSEEQRAIIRQLDQHDIRATVLKGNPPGVRPA
jgi:acyl CoA:acetate/3-ketoacid CoA transferase alpha subunit